MRSLLQRLINALVGVSRWLTYAGAVFLAILMIINVIDIIGTKWFRWTLPGMLDFSEELMVLLTLLPLAFVQKEMGQIDITILTDHLPRIGKTLARHIQYVTGIVVMGFWTWRTFAQFGIALESGDVKLGIGFPTWPGNLAVSISFGMLTLMLLLLYMASFAERPPQQQI